MSLINQMLRDLESRNTTNITPSGLQHKILVTQPAKSKIPFMIWALLAIVSASGTYWTYQSSKMLTKKSSIVIADNIKNDAKPIIPYEKVLTASNAVNNSAPNAELKPSDNTTIQPISIANPIPALQATPLEQPKPATQITPPTQSKQAPQITPPAQSRPATHPTQVLPSAQEVPLIVAEPPVKQLPIATQPASIKLITTKQQADLLYRQAENNSDDYSVSYKLEQALKLDPRHLKARLLLAKTLHKHGQTNKTAEFLDQSLILFPDNLQFINTRAQLYLQQKNPSGALKTLQHIGLANSSNETYLSLLAATYQQMGSYPDAAKVYQRLVIVNPEKAESWLGLALSQDKLGNLKMAREAYQQALSKNILNESITAYIKQRLNELR